MNNLIGQKFGRLTVVKRVEDYISPKGQHSARYLCKCDCGNESIVKSIYLKSGHTKSCGCIRSEKITALNKKYNTYDLSGEYGIGYTSKNEPFYFDLEDYDLIKNYMWSKDNNGYIRTVINNKTIKMHRLIMNPSKNNVIDHINHIVFDNRKNNLRICTYQENRMNTGLRSNNTSGETGVYFNKEINKWTPQIYVNGNAIRLGNYSDFNEAVKARKIAEKKYFGEFSYDNSILEKN